MTDLVDTLDLRPLLAEGGIEWREGDFEELYARLIEDEDVVHVVGELERRVRSYFLDIRLPDSVTLYDELLVTLRGKDVIASFNWDPLLLQAYRRNYSAGELPNILFLHGNVAVGVCSEHERKGNVGDPCQECGVPLEPSRLLYPIEQKDYTDDPFIAAEWEELTSYLERAYLLTVFGYSAPDSDVEAVRLLTDVWQRNPVRELAEIFIVDILERAALEQRWSPFFVRNHYQIQESVRHTPQWRHPRRTCDAFAMATLQLRPCSGDPLPSFQKLNDLHEWISPLIEEEKALEDQGEPFTC